jgi:cysteine desulfurase
MTQGNIYLDYNATTPVDPIIKTKVLDWISFWGNPSSIHQQGRGPKKLLRESRRKIAEKFNCHPLEVIFTGGGSESNNLAIKGCALAYRKINPQRNKIILGAIEHPSILKQINFLEDLGFIVKVIPVDRQGAYDLDFYKKELDESLALVSVMLANNELGIIAPIRQMVDLAHKVGAYFHSDMVQALGKYSFSLDDLNVDLASFSAHKIYALKGSGILYVKKGTPLISQIDGGSQERYRRAGTENVLAIASFSQMIELIDTKDFVSKISPLRDLLEDSLLKKIPDVEILCDKSERLVNTSCFCIKGMSGETLLMNLDIKGFSVATGAACSSGNPEPSPVLLAIGLSFQEAQSSLRISLGKYTNQQEIEKFVEVLVATVNRLRELEESGELNV